jgi:hypothetical protein
MAAVEELTRATFAFYLIFGGTLALIIGLVLLARYRRAVDRAMREGSSTISPPATLADHGSMALRVAPITFNVISAAALGGSRKALQSPTFRTAHHAMLRTTIVYVIAGLTQAIVSVVLLFTFAGTAFLPLRTAISVWSYAWPIVLTVALIWARDRRVWAAGTVFFGALAMLAVWAELVAQTPPLRLAGVPLPAVVQPLLVWAAPAVPTGLLLLFLNRRVRAIGPLLLACLLAGLAGAYAAFVLMTTEPGASALAGTAAALGIEVRGLFYLGQATAFAIALVPGLALARSLRNLYLRKQLSEQSLIIDSMWFMAALVLCSSLAAEQPHWGWLGLSAFAAYLLVVHVGLRPLYHTALQQRPARLLLLRVFGNRARSERLFDLLGSRWRYAGPMQLIAGTDLAASGIEPDEFLDFVSGRLRRRFIHDPAGMMQALREVDNAPDPDGRYRVNAFFCASVIWQATVRELVVVSDLIVMDLRGFSPASQGCIFELGVLVDTVRIERISFLVDDSTDSVLLRDVLEGRWRTMPASSPNAGLSRAEITFLKTTGAEVAAAETLMRMGDQILSEPLSGRSSAPASRDSGRPAP